MRARVRAFGRACAYAWMRIKYTYLYNRTQLCGGADAVPRKRYYMRFGGVQGANAQTRATVSTTGATHALRVHSVQNITYTHTRTFTQCARLTLSLLTSEQLKYTHTAAAKCEF